MKKIFALFITALVTLSAADIKVDVVLQKSFGKVLLTNAKIVQLKNQRQEIVSRLGGHLENYYVNILRISFVTRSR